VSGHLPDGFSHRYNSIGNNLWDDSMLAETRLRRSNCSENMTTDVQAFWRQRSKPQDLMMSFLKSARVLQYSKKFFQVLQVSVDSTAI
jgi:hypothetical protein